MCYVRPLSFSFGINWVVRYRTEENCLHICLHICLHTLQCVILLFWQPDQDYFTYTRVLGQHLPFVAHVRQNCAETLARKERAQRRCPLFSAWGFHLEKKYLYLSYLFRFYLKFSKWPSWRFITKPGCMVLSSKELLLCVMYHYRVMLASNLFSQVWCVREIHAFLSCFLEFKQDPVNLNLYVHIHINYIFVYTTYIALYNKFSQNGKVLSAASIFF